MIQNMYKRVKRMILTKVNPSAGVMPFYGRMLRMDKRNTLYMTYKQFPLYNSEIGRLVKVINRKYNDLTVIDVGANIGDTLYIIKDADISANVICFEGDDYSYSYLEKNASEFTNVFLSKNYLGEKNEVLNIHFDQEKFNNTILLGKGNGNKQIKINKLDDVITNSFLQFKPTIKLLKVDTEGFDINILLGGLEMIRETKPIIHFEYNRLCMDKNNIDGLSIFETLKRHGYDRVLFFENVGRLFLDTKLENMELIHNLHEAVDGVNSFINYWDLCLFHKDDDDIAKIYLEGERNFRNTNSYRLK